MSDRIERLKSFLEQSPNDCFLNHALALEYVKINELPAARDRFEHNLSHDPAYLATYYHLGKLLEQLGQTGDAIQMYERGMAVAKAEADNHTYNELQAAYEDLAY